MEIIQFQHFAMVAEELHFGRAAKRLHVVQPTVSQQVRRLENSLHTRLFERSTRKVELTDAGVTLLPTALRIIATAQEARLIAAQYSSWGVRQDG